jgi:hypothetical protein
MMKEGEGGRISYLALVIALHAHFSALFVLFASILPLHRVMHKKSLPSCTMMADLIMSNPKGGGRKTINACSSSFLPSRVRQQDQHTHRREKRHALQALPRENLDSPPSLGQQQQGKKKEKHSPL